MNENFHKSIKHWFDKSKLALENRVDKKNELLKRLKLVNSVQENPDFSINMVNVCGVYNIAGGNPVIDQSYYTGLLNVDLISNQIEVSWLIEGAQHQTGYGFVFNNTLVIHFNYMVDGDLFNGVVAYQFLTPEILIGKWTEEVAIENAFEMGRKLTPKELGEPNPEDFFSAN